MDVPASDPRCKRKPLFAPLSFPVDIERTEDDGGCRVTLNTLDGKQAIVDLVVHPD